MTVATRAHLLTIDDLSREAISQLVATAVQMKRDRQMFARALEGRILALVFEKPSTRTRLAFEVGMLRLGGQVVSLRPEDAQLGQREEIRDVARVLARYVDGIAMRTFSHATLQEVARYATVPVINGLSDLHHPCQALSDLLTIQERFRTLEGLTIGYIGDGNNVLHSLLQSCALMGMTLQAATPKGYEPNAAIWRGAEALARRHGGTLKTAATPAEAAKAADVLYTDVWTSMGQEAQATHRRGAFHGYQITTSLLRQAKPHCVVMHCLPAHRGEEITDEVLEGPASVVFDQAENRLYMHQAILHTALHGS